MTQNILDKIRWPQKDQDQSGWIMWSSPSENDKGLHISAVKDDDELSLRVEVWGVGGLPSDPLDALFEKDEGTGKWVLQQGSLVGKPVSDEDEIVKSFCSYVDQVDVEPTINIIKGKSDLTP